jgi:mannose-1-phosphate guanylyltransferase/phosphomannomutase
MRAVLEQVGERTLDTTDGVRVVERDGAWVLVLPDPAEAVTQVTAEGSTRQRAAELLDEWARTVELAAAV